MDCHQIDRKRKRYRTVGYVVARAVGYTVEHVVHIVVALVVSHIADVVVFVVLVGVEELVGQLAASVEFFGRRYYLDLPLYWTWANRVA